MKHILAILVLSLAMRSVVAQSTECVGDHHEGCPVLVVTEETRADPGCKGHQEISHNIVMWLFKGVLARKTGDSLKPITQAKVFRECLDEAGLVVRSCPLKFKLALDGSFSLSLSRETVGESLCRADVLTMRSYEETVHLRFQADGCDDLVVRSTWQSPSAPLIMECGRSE